MQVNTIEQISVDYKDSKTAFQEITITIDYNNGSTYSTNISYDSLSDSLLILLFAYYYILDRLGFTEKFNYLLAMINLEYSAEFYGIFVIQKIGITQDQGAFKLSDTFQNLKSQLDIDWDNLQLNTLLNIKTTISTS